MATTQPGGRYIVNGQVVNANGEPIEEAEEDGGYADMDKDELEAEAERRDLEVTRSDGKDGDPLKSDYVAALEASDG